jgi:hypothetical protein
LLHFLLLGAVLFAAFSVLSGRGEPRDDEIVVPDGKIEHLAALFERTWQRPPTREEVDGLIEDYIREEAAYREGVALGLDRDDTIIRRRVRQKLDFIAEDLAGRIEPTEDDLAAYLAQHPDDFRVDPRLSFRQVYLDPEARGDSLPTDARDLLRALNGDPAAEAGTLGDRILLEPAYDDVSTRDVDSLFGEAFGAAVAGLEPGRWQGPIRSAYGVHLVRVDERVEGRVPDLAEVRSAVLREWVNVQRQEMIEKFYRDLLARYRVTVEWPDPMRDGGS